jgi:polysaccharide biosynthesis transport protein
MAPNPTYQATQTSLLEARADLEAASKDLPVILEQIDALSARLAERSRQQSNYQDLVREYQIDDENYRAYLQAVQQARIADDLNKEKASTVAVFDAAHLYSALPTKPRTLLIIGSGTALGLILGLSLAFLLETLDERLNTPWQVNKLTGLAVLGSMRNF